MAIEKKLTHKASATENFNSYLSDDVETLYVDGINRINVGSSVTRFELFVLDSSGQPVGTNIPSAGGTAEERHITNLLVMPTKAVAAFLQLTLSSLKQNEAALMKLYAEDANQLKNLLDSIEMRNAK
jgi:hypothetical protein